uniref:Uncharacterized protein n=1 Tax=Octopus bimaculoides TaxID=37653 RepID=A0A0L8G593_OCTBM
MGEGEAVLEFSFFFSSVFAVSVVFSVVVIANISVVVFCVAGGVGSKVVLLGVFGSCFCCCCWCCFCLAARGQSFFRCASLLHR